VCAFGTVPISACRKRLSMNPAATSIQTFHLATELRLYTGFSNEYTSLLPEFHNALTTQ